MRRRHTGSRRSEKGAEKMLCENCGKRPAQKFVRNVDGREIVVELCPACFRALYGEKKSAPFASLIGRDSDHDDAVCPDCGTTFGDYRRTGLLGCAGCYRVFREEISSAVRGIQSRPCHVGKHPVAHSEEDYDRIRAYVTRRESLRGELEAALKQQDYSSARKLRHELRELAQEGSGEKRG